MDIISIINRIQAIKQGKRSAAKSLQHQITPTLMKIARYSLTLPPIMLKCMWLADQGIFIQLQAGILTCMFLLELLQMQVKYTNELGAVWFDWL